MVKQIKKDNMRTTIVIFTDHKVPVSEIPNYNKNTSIEYFQGK